MNNEFADALENDKDKTDKVEKDNRISDFSLEESKICNHWEKKSTFLMDSADNTTSFSFSKGQSVITWHDQEEVKVLFQSAPIFNAEYYLKQTQKHAASIPKSKYKNRKFVSLPEEKSSEFYELLLTTCKTLHDKINKSYLILDCRSNIEFEIAHIKNSINITSPKNLIQYLFGKKKNTISMLDASTIIIFCCSNSKDISPFLMRFTRNMDRLIHHESYPLLAFPIMYLLKGGVAQYFIEYPVSA
jgi:hypothetical protein